jgi:hypothetical protein
MAYNKTAFLLLKWLKERYNYNIQNETIAHSKAQEHAREYWLQFGEGVIKKALHHKACTSIRGFEMLCFQFQELENKKS